MKRRMRKQRKDDEQEARNNIEEACISEAELQLNRIGSETEYRRTNL